MNSATERVVRAVAAHYCVPFEAASGRQRTPTIALARMVAMYVLREYQTPRPSFPELGVEFARDHTTVMHGVQLVSKRLASDASLLPAIAVGKQALEKHSEVLEQLRLIEWRRQRNELAMQIRALDEAAGIDTTPSLIPDLELPVVRPKLIGGLSG
jgi:hypothetical protein